VNSQRTVMPVKASNTLRTSSNQSDGRTALIPKRPLSAPLGPKGKRLPSHTEGQKSRHRPSDDSEFRVEIAGGTTVVIRYCIDHIRRLGHPPPLGLPAPSVFNFRSDHMVSEGFYQSGHWLCGRCLNLGKRFGWVRCRPLGIFDCFH
jgi:hypothetical protein